MAQMRSRLVSRDQQVRAGRGEIVPQQRLVDRLRVVSPAILVQDSLADVAGTGAPRHQWFVQQVDAFHRGWRSFFNGRVAGRVRLDDYQQVPQFTFVEEPIGAVLLRTGRSVASILLLTTLTVIIKSAEVSVFKLSAFTETFHNKDGTTFTGPMEITWRDVIMLVGGGFLIFFLLLLSLSEHIAFGWAYLVAALACIGLIGFYVGNVLRSRVRGLGFAAMLGLLYAALYGLLMSEDNALVLGAGLLFVVLAVIMVATRKVDWYQVGARIGTSPSAPR